MTYITLSDEELIILDGRSSAKVQEAVDAAKSRLESIKNHPEIDNTIASFVANVVEYAKRQGKLVFYHKSVTACPVCKISRGYAKYPRSGRHHRKGDNNYDRPLLMSAVELGSSFVSIKNTVTLGCCTDCLEKAKPLLAEELALVKAEIPEAITGIVPKYKRVDRRKCLKCSWEGPETEMGKLPAIMGGYYPGECPKCHNKSLPFGGIVFESAGWVVLNA